MNEFDVLESVIINSRSIGETFPPWLPFHASLINDRPHYLIKTLFVTHAEIYLGRVRNAYR